MSKTMCNRVSTAIEEVMQYGGCKKSNLVGVAGERAYWLLTKELSDAIPCAAPPRTCILSYDGVDIYLRSSAPDNVIYVTSKADYLDEP